MNDRPTPETDQFKVKLKTTCGEKYWVPVEHSDRLERERDEAREALSEIALYLSVGMGDKTITAQQYQQRILDGIKMLSEPIVNLWKQAEKERDEAQRACQLAHDRLLRGDNDSEILDILAKGWRAAK